MVKKTLKHRFLTYLFRKLNKYKYELQSLDIKYEHECKKECKKEIEEFIKKNNLEEELANQKPYIARELGTWNENDPFILTLDQLKNKEEKWISVKDDLPDESGIYMCLNNSKKEEIYWDINGQDWYIDEAFKFCTCNVTHWMKKDV